jgi:hypothetical protein
VRETVSASENPLKSVLSTSQSFRGLISFCPFVEVARQAADHYTYISRSRTPLFKSAVLWHARRSSLAVVYEEDSTLTQR